MLYTTTTIHSHIPMPKELKRFTTIPKVNKFQTQCLSYYELISQNARRESTLFTI